MTSDAGKAYLSSVPRPRARWLEASIRATAEAAEALAALFDQASDGAVVVEPDLVRGEEADESLLDPSGYSRLRAYLPDDAALASRRETLESRVALLRAFELAPMDELEFRWVDEDDWANAWKRHYAVQRIGRTWVIKPEWQAYEPAPGDRILELDPGMAFGTGLHPTTQSVLGCLEELDDAGEVAGRAILDLGTGSGILAVGAVRLGASPVHAWDVDPIAVTAAAHNAHLNGVGGSVEVELATLGEPIAATTPVPGRTPESAYDGILANIVARVIAERAPAIAGALRPGGWLVTSGIIADREAIATDALVAAGLHLEARHERGDWVTIVWRRP
jgi:ribosomal protein L11 methyltransferase